MGYYFTKTLEQKPLLLLQGVLYQTQDLFGFKEFNQILTIFY